MSMRLALVEPYLGGSHRAFAQGYATHSAHEVDVCGLAATHWKWRMHGGHVTLAARLATAVADRGPFDVVLATSMTNVPALLGLARRTIGNAGVATYFHENQLTFPWSPDDREDLTYAMINWTSMVASDLVVFNSAYHRDEWFGAIPDLLRRFPDHRHGHLVDAVAGRSIVVPVGVDLAAIDAIGAIDATGRPHDRPLVLWNQRWEYDKGPAAFATAITRLVEDGAEFEVALAGERSSTEPPEFAALRATLGDRLVHDGEADLSAYRRLLRRADIVVSTARHEFFGVAITEAIAAGAFPILPNRLVYPERIPAEFHPICLYDTPDDLVERLGWAIERRTEAAGVAASLRPAMDECGWPAVAPRLDAALGAIAPGP